MSRNFIVYQSRNRLTGTMCQTLDTKHPDSTIPFKPETRYVARCVEHDTQVTFKEHYPAGRAIAHVDEWCKECKVMIRKHQKIREEKPATIKPAVATMTPPDLTAPVHNDLRMASHNNARDKRWRETTGPKRSETRAANDARSRQQRQSRKPSEVTTKVAAK